MIWTNCESERDEISKGYKGYSCHMLIYRYESNMYIFFCTWDGLEPCRLRERERERHNFHVRINTIKYAFFVFFLICKLYTYKSYMYVIEHVFLYKNIYIYISNAVPRGTSWSPRKSMPLVPWIEWNSSRAPGIVSRSSERPKPMRWGGNLRESGSFWDQASRSPMITNKRDLPGWKVVRGFFLNHGLFIIMVRHHKFIIISSSA